MESGDQVARSCMLAFATISLMTGLTITTCCPSNMQDGSDRVWPTLRRLSEELSPTVIDKGPLSKPRNMLAERVVNVFEVPFQSDVWAMEVSPSENLIYFVMAGMVWKVTLGAASSKIEPVPGAEPSGVEWNYPQSFAIVPLKTVNNLSNKILYRANAKNKTLYAYSIESKHPTVPRRQNLSDIIGDGAITSLASDRNRSILYLSTGTRIFRLNVTVQFNATTEAEEPWIDTGNPSGSLPYPAGQHSFGEAFLSKYAISADGRVIYVADRARHVIGQVDVASGDGKIIAGNGTQGAADGRPLAAQFDQPQGLALTPDGCHLFVAEYGGGGIRLITFNHEGDVVNVSTVASMIRPNWTEALFFSLAISDEGDELYAGTFGKSIFVFPINKSALPSCRPLSKSEQSGTRVTAIVVAVMLSLLIFFSAVMAWIVWRKKQSMRRKSGASGMKDALVDVSKSSDTWTSGIQSDKNVSGSVGYLQLPDSSVKRYPIKEMVDACDGFNTSNLLGKGGAADVFKGVLSSGQVVAIKLMKGECTEVKFRQFQAELSVLSTLRHSHLCHIIGYSTDGQRSLIVYPFVGGGTLYDRLHSLPTAVVEPGGNSSSGTSESTSLPHSPLDWMNRVSISIQVAKALRYLHEEVNPSIIHRDVKSKNVLLDDDDRGRVRAYLSDFGLAKLGQSVFGNEADIQTIETYHVSGTIGYMAPEYYGSLRLTYKNDVYAFGVLLLELITGRKAFSLNPSDVADGTQTVVIWAKRKLRVTENNSTGAMNLLERVRGIADVRLETAGAVDWSSVCGVLELAMECVGHEPDLRPRMSDVVQRLSRPVQKP